MRTLNDIIPPSRRKETEPLTSSSVRIPTDKPRRFPYTTLGIAALIIVISIGALFYFSVAKVEVTPNSVSVAVQDSFSANKGTGSLPFEIITAQKVASQSVKGSGTKTVNSSASGTITIYITQSKPQTLVANTRFATAAGLVFKISARVTIPSGTAEKPGSITAKVTAAQPGDSYNIAATSFTLPGLAGTPEASKVYARSTSAMTGGASGNVPVVDTVLETEARSALKTALAPDLLADIQTQIPSGYLLVPGSATTKYEDLALVPSSDGMVDVKEQGTITAVVFPNAALAKAIASSATTLGYQGEHLTLVSADSLSLSTVDTLSLDAETFSFSLSGTASLVYTVDPSRIAAAVAGKTRSNAEVAVSGYPEVKRALIVLRPFWRQTFPQDPSSISVVVTTP